MDKKALVLAVLLAVALTAAVWTYKGQNFQDNQVVVYLTGSELAAGVEAGELPVEFREIPEIETGKPVEVQINGVTTSCQLTSFNGFDSRSTGTACDGGLETPVTMPVNGPYYFVWQDTLRKRNGNGANYGTTELVNSLEIATCAVSAKTGAKLRIGDMSGNNGGSLTGHKCHESGREADVQLVCTKPDGTKYGCGDGNQFDPAGSWAFVKALSQKTPIKRIFLDQRLINKLRDYAFNNDPYTDYNFKQQIFSKLLGHVPNHYSHFHVRIWCSRKDSQCVDDNIGFRGEAGTELDVEQEEQAEAPPLSLNGVASDEELLAKADLNPNKCLYFDDLNPIITYCSQKYGVDEYLIKAVMLAESGSGCDKKGGKPRDKSSADAIGLMQITKSAVDGSNRFRPPNEQLSYPGDLYKPSKNICAGAQELAAYWDTRIYRKLPYNIRTVEDALASYNAGIGKFQRGEVPSATYDYIDRIKRYYTELSGVAFNSNSLEAPGLSVNAWGRT